MSRFEESIDCYDKAIQLNPNQANTFNNKGNCLAKIKKYQEAIDSYDKAIELNPKYAMAYYNKGVSLEKIKNYQETKILDNEGNQHPIRIILFAPTAFSTSNTIYEKLNIYEHDIHLDYSDMVLSLVLEQIKEENEEIKEYKEKMKLIEKFKKVK